jgi:hypothetical protein
MAAKPSFPDIHDFVKNRGQQDFTWKTIPLTDEQMQR